MYKIRNRILLRDQLEKKNRLGSVVLRRAALHCHLVSGQGAPRPRDSSPVRRWSGKLYEALDERSNVIFSSSSPCVPPSRSRNNMRSGYLEFLTESFIITSLRHTDKAGHDDPLTCLDNPHNSPSRSLIRTSTTRFKRYSVLQLYVLHKRRNHKNTTHN